MENIKRCNSAAKCMSLVRRTIQKCTAVCMVPTVLAVPLMHHLQERMEVLCSNSDCSALCCCKHFCFLDGSKPEGTLRLMIQNFRNMTDTIRGPGKVVNGVPWSVVQPVI